MKTLIDLLFILHYLLLYYYNKQCNKGSFVLYCLNKGAFFYLVVVVDI